MTRTVNVESAAGRYNLAVDEKVVRYFGDIRSRYVSAFDCRYRDVMAKLTVTITSILIINSMRREIH